MARDQYHGVTEQAKAAKQRWEDALALFEKGRYRGAMYVAGYAVECLLKTKLMRMYDCRQLRELENELHTRGTISANTSIFTHQLALLLRLTRAADRLRNDSEKWRLFATVNRWVPAWRYNAKPCRAEDAEDYLEAVRTIVQWIEANV
jgi:HEPN domain-containing protein